MPISVGLHLDQSESEIKKLILEASVSELNRIYSQLPDRLLRVVKTYVFLLFKQTSTYEALTEGYLRGHFGFPKGTEVQRVDAIVNEIANSTQAVFIPFTSSGRSLFGGGLDIHIGSKEFSRYINLPGSTITYESETNDQLIELPWAKWLLEEGSKVIISKYHITLSSLGVEFSKFSRSGIAMMFPGGSWSVPSEDSGTFKDNWITRTFLQNQETMMSAISNAAKLIIERGV